MITVLYSFNKTGYEAAYWLREIAAGSTREVRFIPFNHEPYLPVQSYIRAQLLDDRYYENNAGLLRLYDDINEIIRRERVDALLVDTCPPYHPDFLRRMDIHKVLRTGDGPMSAYDRDFAYVHAYDQVLYHSPAYSRDMGMREKLLYCGAKRCDFWPMAAFDATYDSSATESEIFAQRRDLDIVFVGGLHLNKMPILARVRKEFGKRCVIHGLASWKKNVYFNTKYAFPSWVTPLPASEYVSLYKRAKIGFNVHNRGKYTVGGYRLFELPANGVMQISDGGEYLTSFFEPAKEIVGYETADELINELYYYLEHPDEREAIARGGYRRVLRDHTMKLRLRQAGELIASAIQRAAA